MKKIICTLTVFLFTASLFACGSEKNNSTSKTAEVTTVLTTESSNTTTTTAESSTTSVATSTTEPTITTTEEPTTTLVTVPPVLSHIETSEEYVNEIGKIISIESQHEKAGEMIGAIDGYSFKYQGLSFEIYKYEPGSRELIEGSSGTVTLNMGSFGDLTSDSVVNGEFLMIFDEANDEAINAFKNVNT